MENKNEKKTMRINFRYNSIKKILTRDTSNDNSVKKDEYSTTISRKINKIKPTQSGKQVSFSKKIEQIPLSLAEIGKLKLTPTKYTVNSAKFKPCKEHVKTPFRLEKKYLKEKGKSDKLLFRKNLFINDNYSEDQEDIKNNSVDLGNKEISINNNIDSAEKFESLSYQNNSE